MNEVADAVGPVYDTAGVAARLDVDEADVGALRATGRLLAAQTSDRTWVYPVFQFAAGRVREDLASAILALRGSPRWAAVLWFRTPSPDLDGRTPLEWADDGGDPSAVTAAAEQAARAWA